MRTIHRRLVLSLSVMLLTAACATSEQITVKKFNSEAEAQLAANVTMQPQLAASLTSDAVRRSPREAPALVAAAISVAPERQSSITKAAIAAAPNQADAIMKAARDAARTSSEGSARVRK